LCTERKQCRAGGDNTGAEGKKKMAEQGWKFLHIRDNGSIESNAMSFAWTVGEWAPPVVRPRLCNRGYHDSLTIPDALHNVRGNGLARTEVRGAAHLDDESHPDKRCHAEMRLTAVYRWTKRDSVALAVFAAELVLHVFEDRYPGDDRPRKAIAAAKAYLAGQLAGGGADAYAAAAYAADAADAYAAAAAAADAADAAAYAYAADAYAAAADAAAADAAAADAAADAAAAAAAAADAAAAQRSGLALTAVREQIAQWCEAHVTELECVGTVVA
jgi:hypothetical protein